MRPTQITRRSVSSSKIENVGVAPGTCLQTYVGNENDVVGSPLVDIVEYDDPYDALPTHIRWSENTTPAAVPYGSSCGGLALAGAITAPAPGRLTLTMQGAAPFALGALVFGTTRFELPLPPTGCPLRTEPLVVLPIPVDGSGRASLGLNLPGFPVTANVQALAGAGSPVSWATSQGLGLFVR